MNLTDLTRSAAKMPYIVARLPLGLVEDQVVVRYLDNASPARIGYERFLGSVDKIAGRLLDDDGISRRGQALLRKTDFLAKAEELDAKAEARRARADDDLHAVQGQAVQARAQAQREKYEKVSAAEEQEQKDKQKAEREAKARAEAGKNEAEQAAKKRTEDAEGAKQTEHKRIAAREDRATVPPKRQLSDAADKRNAAKDRQQEADRLEQLTEAERNARKSS